MLRISKKFDIYNRELYLFHCFLGDINDVHLSRRDILTVCLGDGLLSSHNRLDPMSHRALPFLLDSVQQWPTLLHVSCAILSFCFETKPRKQKTNGSLIKMKGELNWATKHENEWIYFQQTLSTIS